MNSMRYWQKCGLILLVCGLALGLRLVLSYLSILHVPPSADEAIAIMLAESIARGEDYPLLFTGQPYQFPIEAYLMSPLVEAVPRGTLGARYQALLLGLVATTIFLAAAFRAFDKGGRWPALLLIALPSAYWLLQQSAYLPPQYAISSVFAALLFYLAVTITRDSSPSYVLIFSAGLVSGLALSNHLLLISVVAGFLLIVTFNRQRSLTFLRIPAFAVGLLLGLTPFILAVSTIPGAYQDVSSTVTLPAAVDRLFNIVVPYALPGAMGVNPRFFADYPARVMWSPALGPVFAIGFSVLLVFIILARIRSFIVVSKMARWPVLGLPDMFVITTLLALIVMAMNARGAGHDHRYLMPVVWSFPFLVGYAYSLHPPALTRFFGGLAVVIAMFNVAVSIAVIEEWRKPQIRYVAAMPDLTALYEFLRQKNLHHCYATFWLAPRITFETNEEIICTQAYNERFYDWPLPYKSEVDQQQDVAFVFLNAHGSKFWIANFEKLMDHYGIQYQKTRVESLYVLHDFSYPAIAGMRNLEFKPGAVSTQYKDVDAGMLIDGRANRAWQPTENQQRGQWVELDLGAPVRVQNVVLHYPWKEAPPPRLLDISGRKNGQWSSLKTGVPYQRDPGDMQYENGHPVFGGVRQTIRFSPEFVDGIRLTLAEPSGDHPWALSELEVTVTEAD